MAFKSLISSAKYQKYGHGDLLMVMEIFLYNRVVFVVSFLLIQFWLLPTTPSQPRSSATRDTVRCGDVTVPTRPHTFHVDSDRCEQISSVLTSQNARGTC